MKAKFMVVEKDNSCFFLYQKSSFLGIPFWKYIGWSPDVDKCKQAMERIKSLKTKIKNKPMYYSEDGTRIE